MLKYLFNNLKQYIFPVFCLGCDKEGEWLCEKCDANAAADGIFCCPACHQISVGGRVCPSCHHQSDLFMMIAMHKNTDKSIQAELVKNFKYNFVQDLLPVINDNISKFLFTHGDIFAGFHCVCPIPLHRKRQAQRGFNQCDYLARSVGRALNLPVVEALIRVKNTGQQARLARAQRIKNMTGAFTAKDSAALDKKKIILVDDVYTSGATMRAAAAALKEKYPDCAVGGFCYLRG